MRDLTFKVFSKITFNYFYFSNKKFLNNFCMNRNISNYYQEESRNQAKDQIKELFFSTILPILYWTVGIVFSSITVAGGLYFCFRRIKKIISFEMKIFGKDDATSEEEILIE